jgi:hypothetical protein
LAQREVSYLGGKESYFQYEEVEMNDRGDAVKQAKEANSSLDLFREQLARSHHLDWLALTTFALLATLALALVVIHALIELPGWPLPAAGLMAVALTAGGAHSLVTNAGDNWVTLTAASQALRGSGLTERGIFPSSLIAYPPRTRLDFTRRLVFGSRGGLLLLYVIVGGLAGFSVVHHYLVLPAALVLGGIIPLFFTALSIRVSFARLRHLLLSLVEEVELAGESREELAERHCAVAESLVFLDPPRIREAISHYEIALELEPENARAQEALQRLKTRLRTSSRQANSSARKAS